jgi:hypothetical protein
MKSTKPGPIRPGLEFQEDIFEGGRAKVRRAAIEIIRFARFYLGVGDPGATDAGEGAESVIAGGSCAAAG